MPNLSTIIPPGNIMTASGTQTLTNKTINAANNTLTGVATLTGTETLTNKTINAANNTLTGVATLTGTETLTNKTINAANNTLTGVATLTGTETLTNKTLQDITLNTDIKEKITVSATAATGTIPINVLDTQIVYYTSNASANFTVNIRGNASTTLDSLMQVGEVITVTFLNTNGTTAYYNNVVQVDGSAVTPNWQGGTAPTLGNSSSIDSYSYTIIKTAVATFKVLAAQTQFK